MPSKHALATSTDTLMTVVMWLVDSMSSLLAATPLLMYRLLVIWERPWTEGCPTAWARRGHSGVVIEAAGQRSLLAASGHRSRERVQEAAARWSLLHRVWGTVYWSQVTTPSPPPTPPLPPWAGVTGPHCPSHWFPWQWQLATGRTWPQSWVFRETPALSSFYLSS